MTAQMPAGNDRPVRSPHKRSRRRVPAEAGAVQSAKKIGTDRRFVWTLAATTLMLLSIFAANMLPYQQATQTPLLRFLTSFISLSAVLSLLVIAGMWMFHISCKTTLEKVNLTGMKVAQTAAVLLAALTALFLLGSAVISIAIFFGDQSLYDAFSTLIPQVVAGLTPKAEGGLFLAVILLTAFVTVLFFRGLRETFSAIVACINGERPKRGISLFVIVFWYVCAAICILLAILRLTAISGASLQYILHFAADLFSTVGMFLLARSSAAFRKALQQHSI